MKIFENVSEKSFSCLKGKLESQGITLEGTQGYLSKNGISLDYTYDPGPQTLEIKNLSVGFPATMIGMNEKKVLGILEKTIEDCK